MEARRPPIAARVWGVIPVFNHQATVAAVARACRAELPHVLVVDDGSTDADVAALFQGTDIVVVTHPRNRGKGCALRTALRYVREQGGEFMITVDADGQHDPRDIRTFLPVIEGDPAAIVIGARRMDAPDVPAASRFGMRFSDLWLRLETGVRVQDSQSGMRAYPVAYVSGLSMWGRGYDFEVEVLAKAAWAGLAIRSVDVGVRYGAPGRRVSHFRPFLDNLRISRMHAALVGRRLLPWPHRRLVGREPDAFRALLKHPAVFLRTLLAEHATPAELGAAAATGIFLATLPLVSLHTLVIVYVATRLKLNRIMAVAIQNLCAPPFVPLACVELGYFMRHGQWLSEMSRETLVNQLGARVWEWLLGSLIAAPVLAVVAGLIVYATAAALVRKPRACASGSGAAP